MKYLTLEAAQKLPTPRLLAFYKKLRTKQFYVSDHVWDCTCESCMGTKKHVSELQGQMDLIKSLLDTREHVK